MSLRTTRGDKGAPTKGRGATSNLEGRFEGWTREPAHDGWSAPHAEGDEAPPPLQTIVTPEHAKSIISRNDSPDVGFEQSVNPYRGCEHGCVYCFARPSHAYLGLSPGLDFETRIFAKVNAAELLRRELAAPGYRCRTIMLGVNTDAYQPAERALRITRSVLEVLAECEHPVALITKSALIERDIDLLAPMARHALVHAHVSITNLDPELARKLEPRAAAPYRRVEAIRRLAEAGVPVGVMVAPVIPSMTDRDLEEILERARVAGATSAGYVLLRLPHEVAPLFKEWLGTHHPLKAGHVISLVRQMSGGKDYDARFGARQRGSGEFAELLAQRFRLACRRLGFGEGRTPLDSTRFRPPRRPRRSARPVLTT
jgi:DNA repair photolyase